jgi:hypothetical protein
VPEHPPSGRASALIVGRRRCPVDRPLQPPTDQLDTRHCRPRPVRAAGYGLADRPTTASWSPVGAERSQRHVPAMCSPCSAASAALHTLAHQSSASARSRAIRIRGAPSSRHGGGAAMDELSELAGLRWCPQARGRRVGAALIDRARGHRRGARRQPSRAVRHPGVWVT